MTMILSIEERVEEFDKCFDGATYKRNGWSSIPLHDINKAKEIFKQALTAERLALLTELLDSGLLEEMDAGEAPGDNAVGSEQRTFGSNRTKQAIKAYINNLINPL